MYEIKPFFVVLARDSEYVKEKIRELDVMGFPYLIVSGIKSNLPNSVYRPPNGKYDAMNFAIHFIPKDVEIVAFNDVDTKIRNFDVALKEFEQSKAHLLFTKLRVSEGPQIFLNSLIDNLKRRLLITASGELILVRRNILSRIFPLNPCKSEDTYIMFKFMEQGLKTIFCESCFVETERTKVAHKEEEYKRRTVTGIYQALTYAKAPIGIRLFYTLLPFLSPILLISGKKGYYTMRGILLGYVDFARGDRSGCWRSSYE